MKFELVPEAMLAARESAVDANRNRLAGYTLSFLDDPLVGKSFRYYLLLTEFPELFAKLALSPEQLFWSRYYWFLRFARLRQIVTGPDAGLEQQAFQILEQPRPECKPNWSAVESVERAVNRCVAELVGAEVKEVEELAFADSGGIWRLVEKRRKQECITRAELERRIAAMEADETSHE